MSWLLYDEKGRRAQKLTLLTISGQVLPGWVKGAHVFGGSLRVLGFLPDRVWHPTFFAAKMSHGSRSDGLRRTRRGGSPTIAAVEMWIRLVGART